MNNEQKIIWAKVGLLELAKQPELSKGVQQFGGSSLHATEIHGIGKGKVRSPYDFIYKVSVESSRSIIG